MHNLPILYLFPAVKYEYIFDYCFVSEGYEWIELQELQ